jgi:ribosomal protein S18 acetylase RimI-like enzyme
VTLQVMSATARDVEAVVRCAAGASLNGQSPARYRSFIDSPRHQLLVARLEGRTDIVGALCGEFVLDTATLLDVFVSPTARGHGFGRQLVWTWLAQLRHDRVERVQLEVRRGNGPALSVYEGLGFAVDGVRAGYYPPLQPGDDREDALLMSLELKDGNYDAGA